MLSSFISSNKTLCLCRFRKCFALCAFTDRLSLRFGDLGGCQGLGAVHSHNEGIANFITPIDLSQQIRRGVAFARSLFKLITEISIRKCCALCAFTDRLSLRFGDLGGCQGLGAEHSRIEGIANFINPIDLSQQIRRGVAFARQFLNPSQKSRSANAAPFVLLPIAYPCGLGIWGGCQRFRAEHSHIEGIANFINLCGNALPLPEFFPFPLPCLRSHSF